MFGFLGLGGSLDEQRAARQQAASEARLSQIEAIHKQMEEEDYEPRLKDVTPKQETLLIEDSGGRDD